MVAQTERVSAALKTTASIVRHDSQSNLISSRSRREDSAWQSEAKILEGLVSQLHADVSGMFDEALAIADSIRGNDFYHDPKKLFRRLKVLRS